MQWSCGDHDETTLPVDSAERRPYRGGSGHHDLLVSAKKRVLAFTEANSISPMDLTGKIYFYPGAIKLAEAGSFGSPAARCAVRMGTEAGGHTGYIWLRKLAAGQGPG